MDKLHRKKKALGKVKNVAEIGDKILQIEDTIDKMLFMPEYISVVIDHPTHYDYIIEHGFHVNGRKFVRLMCSPGNARVNTVVFCQAGIEKRLKSILKNGAKPIKMADSKYNAYFSLTSSATHQVSAPKILVVKDCEIKMEKMVDWVNDEEDDVEAVMKELDFNLFDGQGLISPALAQRFADELELDYLPSAFCIRHVYIKGMVCVIDFHKFAREVAKKSVVTDVWGNDVDINDVEMIITQSQFKLWSAYNSWQHYEECCRNNDLHWGITRVTPKEDNETVFSNYQFLQVLNLNDEQIRSLCQPTLDWIGGVLGGKIEYTMLYMLGSAIEQGESIFAETSDVLAKALMLNKSLIKDSYIKNTIRFAINASIRRAYTGKLLMNGNFQVMISDPYAMLEHTFGLPVVGLLKEFEHYSDFWNKRDVGTVAAMRSPLTWRSEVNILHLQEYSEWFQYITSGIIYNVHGCDCMIAADSDFDMDLVMTTENKEVIKGAYGGLPITYSKMAAEKKETDESELWLADKLSFDSKIGFVTNISTSYYVLYEYYRDLYGPDCDECVEIEKRLKICRKQQGNQIDKTKGIIIKDFPKHWTKAQEGADDNSLVVDKRPYFFRYLYKGYNRDYNEYMSKYNDKANRKFGIEIKSLLEKEEKSLEEQEFIDRFKKRSPLYEHDSVMNKICKYMESQIKEFQTRHTLVVYDEILDILVNDYVPSDKDIKAMERLYDRYNLHKDKIKEHNNRFDKEITYQYDHLYQFVLREARKINSNDSNLATIAATICYKMRKTRAKSFLWKVFHAGLLENIKNNSDSKALVPIRDDNGDILYLGKKYKNVEVDVLDI